MPADAGTTAAASDAGTAAAAPDAGMAAAAGDAGAGGEFTSPPGRGDGPAGGDPGWLLPGVVGAVAVVAAAAAAVVQVSRRRVGGAGLGVGAGGGGGVGGGGDGGETGVGGLSAALDGDGGDLAEARYAVTSTGDEAGDFLARNAQHSAALASL
jgi:hypothetical protein